MGWLTDCISPDLKIWDSTGPTHNFNPLLLRHTSFPSERYLVGKPEGRDARKPAAATKGKVFHDSETLLLCVCIVCFAAKTEDDIK